jgi:AraC-like DNA-binding protein
VKPASPMLVQRMESLWNTWHEAGASPTLRHLRVHALLLEILMELLPPSNQAFRVDRPTHLWWEIETAVRVDLSRPIDMRFLQRLSRRSQQTILRACQLAVGKPPLKRIKDLRLSYARGLVQLSDQTISEIAYRVGYRRVQEFSRDYRNRFGVTPTEDRQRGPDYQQFTPPSR